MEQKARLGIHVYLTPILLCSLGYLLNDKISSIDKRLERLEIVQDTIIQVNQKIIELEKRIERLETDLTVAFYPAKHEDVFTL